MLPVQALDKPPIAPERSLVDARLRGEATAPVSTSQDISEDPSEDEPSPRRTSLKTSERYRKHLAQPGQALSSWHYQAVRGQLRAEPKLGTRSLRACIKSLERDLSSPSSAPKGDDPHLWRAGRRRNRRRLEGAQSPPSQGVSANEREARDRSHLPLALDQLKRVQEYRRRRQSITSGRAPTLIAHDSTPAPDRPPSSPASTARRPRPWLSPTNAARAEGVPRRSWLDREGKLRRRRDLARKHGLNDEDEALFHALAQRQEQAEVESKVIERANILAEVDVVQASVTKAIQVAVYPPEQPKQELVQVATAQGLLADASTYPLPWDSWDIIPDGTSGDAALECNLNCITETGDIRPGWSGLLAAASSSRAPPQRITVGSSRAPTLLLFWAYIAGTRVKVLGWWTPGSQKVVITGCSPGTPDPSRPKDNSMGLVQGVLLDSKRTRKDLRALQAKEENAFVVYLAPDGTFGAEACEGDEPDSVLDAVFEYSDSDQASSPSACDPTDHTSPSPPNQLGTPPLSPLSTSESESEPGDARQLREAVRRESCSSEEDHLDKAIDDHAQGKPPTWYAQAAAALERGRRILSTRRPRRKRVRWSDQKNVCADHQPPSPAEPELAAAVTDDPVLPQDPELKPTTPKTVEDEVDEDVTQEIGQQLRDLEEEFKDVICTELPESVQSREYKASIRLRPDWDGQPLHRRGYKLSQEELRQLRLQLDELLAKGYIRPSASPWGCPVLMVPKPSSPRELRLVIDYRQINEITIKDKYPLPDVQCLLDDMQGATVFSTADALWGFWQVPMEERDAEKTAMTTHFGAYEWLVMPMGLSNSPSTWQRMMNQYLGHLPFCRVFVDDIMIFSATPQEHVDHVRQVLAACRLHKVYLKKSKLKLCMKAVRFLGHVIDKDGCRPQQDKVASVRDWPDLETVTHVRQFLGMCGFYRRYIQSFAHLAHPLTHLTKTGVDWTWGEVEKGAFHRLKMALISTPTLALPD
ncbi:hypothetical protein CYMTET_55276 [Cymbomonas tetramitiformis]|uniref:Reverse transcriptase domain-containing protein n=1 Tax=Cymbomonas tetramitiformis TaxID=36881 RepID=A0AAE0BF21_9CHLO|nr:hypothetical protein CYMTET_55276 [Cymbomonas tetramitiformis]